MSDLIDDRDHAQPVTRRLPVLPEGWLEPEELATAMQPFGRSRMLPAAAYTSPQVFGWEQRHLFAGTWTCVGRESELRSTDGSAPVTQRSIRVGDVAVLLTWPDDEPRAFANTCRHRAHELLPTDDAAGRHSIVCPYHAWSYDLEGTLRAAPSYQHVPGFSPDDHGLVALPVERWGGWVFVHAATPLVDGPPVDFATHLGEAADVLDPYAPEELVLGDRHTYEVAANWKVISENYHECYHCPLIHPELCQVTPPDSGENYDRPGAWAGGSMVLRDGMATMSITGESRGIPIPGVSPTAVEYIGLWPNLLVSAHPDYVMAHRLVPLAPDRTWVECSWYFVPPPDGEAFDPSYAVKFWDITNKEDWTACESVQRGLGSPHYRPGPFGPGEDAVHHFVTMVGRGYLGRPLHPVMGGDAS